MENDNSRQSFEETKPNINSALPVEDDYSMNAFQPNPLDHRDLNSFSQKQFWTHWYDLQRRQHV